jgi:hypothetical protein
LTSRTLCVVAALLMSGPTGLRASETQVASGQVPEATALAQFDAAVADYLNLRRKLKDEIPNPTAGSTSTQLVRATDSLAAAIQRARGKVEAGAIFAAPVSTVVKQRVLETIRRDNLGPVLAHIDDDAPTVTVPAIHLRYPAAAQMATMPPSLLAVLPQLPKELEYRIVGEYLVLRDVDAALIIDFIPAAVPRKP